MIILSTQYLALLCFLRSVSDVLTKKAEMSTDQFPTLTKLGLLNNEKAQIKDKENTERLLHEIINNGMNTLQLIVDFDQTLTKSHNNGQRCLSTWGMFEQLSDMPKTYKDKSHELFNKYYPIEVDPHLDENEKIPHMIEWYRQGLGLACSYGATLDTLKVALQKHNVHFRDGTTDLFKKMKDNKVPLLILSAGLGDVVQQILWNFNLYSENVKVISNFFKFDEQGKIVGFNAEMIHVFNKNENALHDSDYFEVLKHRTNVILMGDSIGDIKMARGAPSHSNILKIGFLNGKIEESKAKYMNAYDIVLLDDQTMNVVNDIVSSIK